MWPFRNKRKERALHAETSIDLRIKAQQAVSDHCA